LIVSQVLTLYTTPAVYLFFDFVGSTLARWRRAFSRLLPQHGTLMAIVLLLLTGCTVGPKYKRPDTPFPVALKESPPKVGRTHNLPMPVSKANGGNCFRTPN